MDHPRAWRATGAAIAIVAGLVLSSLTVSVADTTGTSTVSARAPYTEQATVAKVADGDTVFVKGQSTAIRLIGIDTPDKGTGDCYYLQSKRALKKLVRPNRRVTLSATRKNSASVGNGQRRPLRYVDRGSNDLSLLLLRGGYGVFNNTTTEHARELAHVKEAQYAAQARRGVWRPDLCGTGPEASLRVFVNYNADLLDPKNIPGKYVRIVNDGAPISLSGWTMRLGNRKYFRFPNLVIETGQSIVVHNGAGTPYSKDGDHHVPWGYKVDLPDPRNSVNKAGGVYLQDPQRNYRFWSMWPCVVECSSDSVMGKLAIRAIYKPDEGVKEERVLITNTSSEVVDASFLVAEIGSSVFEVPRGNVLQPGQSITIWVERHGSEYTINRTAPMLSDKSGSVMLRGNDGLVIDVYRW